MKANEVRKLSGAELEAKLVELKKDLYKAAGPWTVTVEPDGTRTGEINNVTVTIYQWKVTGAGLPFLPRLAYWSGRYSIYQRYVSSSLHRCPRCHRCVVAYDRYRVLR